MLKEKIKNKQRGILLYGLTPPKVTYEEQRVRSISQKQIKRIEELDIDGVVLYDIQDEKSRINQKRPFPFLQTLEPSFYAKEYLHVTPPKIIYRAVGKYTKAQTQEWMEDEDLQFCVFVGAASKTQSVSMSIDEAYKLKKDVKKELTLGAIAIAERHRVKKDEDKRVLQKIENGCEFFITQAMYDKKIAKKFLDDLAVDMRKNQMEIPPIIFTLTPCGTTKTLEFMKWLGISIPKSLEQELVNSHDILAHSVRLCKENFIDLYNYAKELHIPIGCNVESVAVKKEEIEASVTLIKEIREFLNEDKGNE